MSSQVELAEQMLAEHRRIETEMSSPEALSSPEKMKSLGRRYAELGRVVRVYEAYRRAEADLSETREIVEAGGEDAELFRPELPGLQEAYAQAEAALKDVLIPRDPDDARDAIVEVKAGEGGEESALFAGDLLRMYERYAERMGWQTQILSSMPTELGGFKDVQMAVRLRSAPAGTTCAYRYRSSVPADVDSPRTRRRPPRRRHGRASRERRRPERVRARSGQANARRCRGIPAAGGKRGLIASRHPLPGSQPHCPRSSFCGRRP